MKYILTEIFLQEKRGMKVYPFSTMEDAMRFLKELIRKYVIMSDASLEEGSFIMLDSADCTEYKPYTYYSYDLVDSESKITFVRLDIIELVPGSCIEF